MSKYVVRVPFNWGDTWIRDENKKVKLFETRNQAEVEAIRIEGSVVEEYYDIENFDWDNLSNSQQA